MKLVLPIVIIGLVCSSVAFAGSGETCYYPDEERHTIMNEKMSLGYNSYQGDRLNYKGGFSKKTGKFYNTISTRAYRASKFTIRVASFYFMPKIAVINSRKQKFIGRPSRDLRGPWNNERSDGLKIMVAEVTFETRKNYGNEPIKIIITTNREHSRNIRGSEVFFHALQTNLKCIYSNDDNRNSNDDNRKRPSFKPGYYLLCDNGKFPEIEQGLLGTTRSWCKDGSTPRKRWLNRKP